MLLNGFNLIHLLLSKGFLKYEDVFKKGISIVPMQSRNFSYKVSVPDETYLFVKQVDFPEPDKIQSLKMEASCYWLAQHEDSLEDLATIFPKYIHFDQHHNILISEQISGAIDLYQYFRIKEEYNPRIGTELGNILAIYHKGMYDRIVAHQSEKLFKQAIPGPFMLFGEQLAHLKPRSEVERKMKELILSQERFSQQINTVKEKWEVKSLTHGDLKFQNFLIRTEDESIRLIDWETADLGDPLWDCAAIIQSFILPWILYQDVESAPSLYRNIQASLPAIHAFCDSYTENMNTDLDTTKLMEYCAVKLLHTCYESNVNAETLSRSGAYLLQLSLNILDDPQKLATEFFEFSTCSYA